MFTTTEKTYNMANIPYKQFVQLTAAQKLKCLTIIQNIIEAIKTKHS